MSARERFFELRHESLYLDLLLALTFATVTGLSAQVAIHTPWSPVPFTLQVLAVLASGIVLGYRWGTASQLLYVLLGVVAIPWFAPSAGQAAFSTGGLSSGALSGLSVISSPVGGYILAFPIAALVVGFVSDRYLEGRSVFSQVGVSLVGVGIIYALGALVFWFVLRLPFPVVLTEAVLLFIPVDLAKAIVAGGIGTVVTAKRPFGPERAPPSGFRRWWPLLR